MANTDKFTLIEPVFDVNEFNKPKELVDNDAICQKLIQIMLLNPGTYPSKPNMGLGLVKLHRYTLDSNIADLISECENQIHTYLPEFERIEVDMKLIEKELFISIKVDEAIFRFVLNHETKTLSSL